MQGGPGVKEPVAGTSRSADASPAAAPRWRTARGTLDLSRPRIAGILNLTPDSFWDGGRHAGLERALRHAESLLADGADILDVGGESTRPGAAPVDAEEEFQRVLPVVEHISRRWPELIVSIDTVKSEVARAAIDAGAAAINDVSALRLDSGIAPLAARTGAGLILMHSRGDVGSMAGYDLAEYGRDPVGEIAAELSAAVDVARTAGVADDAILLDPGLGFSKRTEQSVAALRQLGRLRALGHEVLIGPSRKRFLGDVGGGLPAELRLEGTMCACVLGWVWGARVFRVHDVGPARRTLDAAAALTAGAAP